MANTRAMVRCRSTARSLAPSSINSPLSQHVAQLLTRLHQVLIVTETHFFTLFSQQPLSMPNFGWDFHLEGFLHPRCATLPNHCHKSNSCNSCSSHKRQNFVFDRYFCADLSRTHRSGQFVFKQTPKRKRDCFARCMRKTAGNLQNAQIFWKPKSHVCP